MYIDYAERKQGIGFGADEKSTFIVYFTKEKRILLYFVVLRSIAIITAFIIGWALAKAVWIREIGISDDPQPLENDLR